MQLRRQLFFLLSFVFLLKQVCARSTAVPFRFPAQKILVEILHRIASQIYAVPITFIIEYPIRNVNRCIKFLCKTHESAAAELYNIPTSADHTIFISFWGTNLAQIVLFSMATLLYFVVFIPLRRRKFHPAEENPLRKTADRTLPHPNKKPFNKIIPYIS